MPAWARMSCAPGYASTRRSIPAAIGGRPRPAWTRIGTRRSAASSKTGASRSSLSRNFWARGWSLIPRAPRSRQRRASSIGSSSSAEPHERDEAALGASCELERAVVPGAEARLPVGLVETEDEGPRDAVFVHERRPLLYPPDDPVDVRAEVGGASKMSRSAGRSARSRSSHDAATSPARSSASIPLNLAVHRRSASRADVCRFRADFGKDTVAAPWRAVARSRSSRPPDRRLHEANPPARPAHGSRRLPLGAASARASGSGSIVVGEVFAAGGNSGAAYADDHLVELFNRGAGDVAIDGWTLQYASAASTSWQQTALSGTIPAGGRAPCPSSLPAERPELRCRRLTRRAPRQPRPASSGGKVVVVSGATALSCGAAAGSCSSASGLEDLVGYGSAADFEGSDAAPAGSATNALACGGPGCTDTDDNAADFATAAADPQNSSATATPCSAAPPPNGSSGSAGVDVDALPPRPIALDHPTLSFPSACWVPCPVRCRST